MTKFSLPLNNTRQHLDHHCHLRYLELVDMQSGCWKCGAPPFRQRRTLNAKRLIFTVHMFFSFIKARDLATFQLSLLLLQMAILAQDFLF